MRVNEKPGKRPEAVLLAAGLALLIATSGAVAAVSAQVVAHGRVETGGVDVSLAALSPGAGSLVTGQRAANDVAVTATGGECWIRLKSETSALGAPFGDVTWDSSPEGLSEEWVCAADGWWHLTRPLSAGEAVTWPGSVECPVFEQEPREGGWAWVPASRPLDPTKWADPSPDPSDDPALRAYEEASGAELRVRVTAEAVQRAAFEPDFGADDPWVGVQAEPAMHTYEGEGRI